MSTAEEIKNQISKTQSRQISVRLFALAKQLSACDTIVIELPQSATVRELRAAIVQACPALAGLMPQMLIAVDSEYAEDDTIIGAAKEVGCIPPVSGG
jgi:molybdopterin converting factor small subunit